MADPMNFPHNPSLLDAPSRVSDAEWASEWQSALAALDTGSYAGDSLPPGWRKSYEDQMRGQTLLARLKAEIVDLKELSRQFSGAEATWMRWLIATKVQGLNSNIDSLRGVAPSKRGQAPSPPPIPAWMEEYLEKSIPAAVPEYSAYGEQLARPSPRGARPAPEGAATLRPMGAQAELTPDQMGLMAGYQSWAAAGSPRRYSEGAITEMADWQKHWAQHTRLSESLFPKQAKLGQRWTTALQR